MLATLWENLGKAWHARYPTAVLCHRYKCMYFPVPKAATSSIKRLIAEMDGRRADGNPHHDITLDRVWAKHASQYADYLAFTVVRNPWDRLVSCFTDKVAGRLTDPTFRGRYSVHEGFARYNQIFRRELFRPDMSFAEFVRVVAWIPDALADEHFRSQYRMVSTPGGSLLTERMIKFEDLHAGMTELLHELGATAFDIEHMHRTRHSDYRSFYSNQTREQVGRMYMRDIKLFDYQF
jgi:chondroitin 4-sulfotransferase 11